MVDTYQLIHIKVTMSHKKTGEFAHHAAVKIQKRMGIHAVNNSIDVQSVRRSFPTRGDEIFFKTSFGTNTPMTTAPLTNWRVYTTEARNGSVRS